MCVYNYEFFIFFLTSKAPSVTCRILKSPKNLSFFPKYTGSSPATYYLLRSCPTGSRILLEEKVNYNFWKIQFTFSHQSSRATYNKTLTGHKPVEEDPLSFSKKPLIVAVWYMGTPHEKTSENMLGFEPFPRFLIPLHRHSFTISHQNSMNWWRREGKGRKWLVHFLFFSFLSFYKLILFFSHFPMV